MTYSHIKQPGLLIAILLVGVASYCNYSQATSPHSLSIGYATHGLRVYIDPDTGQFGRPPAPSVQPTDINKPSLSASISTNRPANVTLSEQASGKTGGGYAIDLRELYRPNAHGS